MRLILCYAIGLIFGLGISVSGMANPAKVLNFFDVAGHWDPSLMFVMGGAVTLTFFGYRWVLKRPRPNLEPVFYLPQNRRIGAKLLAGAAVFGVGWGLAGFCPGGSLPAIGTGDPKVLIFAAAMLAGMYVVRLINTRAAAHFHAPQFRHHKPAPRAPGAAAAKT